MKNKVKENNIKKKDVKEKKKIDFKNIKEKLIKFFSNKKVIYALLILLVVAIIGIVIYKVVDTNNNKNTISYNEIKKMVDKQENFLIYYYNSKSKNKNNRDIKGYLDKSGIRYYNYNDVYVDREEYNNFLKLINIDTKSFGTPAIIYIKDGKMYSNLINIDSKEVVETFIDDYDLYTVK